MTMVLGFLLRIILLFLIGNFLHIKARILKDGVSEAQVALLPSINIENQNEYNDSGNRKLDLLFYYIILI